MLVADEGKAVEIGVTIARGVGHDVGLIDHPVHVDAGFHCVVGKAEDAGVEVGVFLEAAGDADAGTGVVDSVDAGEGDGEGELGMGGGGGGMRDP